MQDAGISGIKEKSESAITTDVITRMNKPLWFIADKKGTQPSESPFLIISTIQRIFTSSYPGDDQNTRYSLWPFVNLRYAGNFQQFCLHLFY